MYTKMEDLQAAAQQFSATVDHYAGIKVGPVTLVAAAINFESAVMNVEGIVSVTTAISGASSSGANQLPAIDAEDQAKATKEIQEANNALAKQLNELKEGSIEISSTNAAFSLNNCKVKFTSTGYGVNGKIIGEFDAGTINQDSAPFKVLEKQEVAVAAG